MFERSHQTLSRCIIDEDVFKNFSTIVTKTKKFAKPELKQQVEEWETKLVEHSNVGLENKLAGDKAVQAKQKASRRQRRKNAVQDEMNMIDKENIPA